MKIRKMNKEDYEKLYDLWLSCKGMGLNSIDDSREGIERFLNRNPDTCFTAEEGNRIVGAIMAGSDGRRGYIYHTAVHPDFRKRGIGSELVKSVTDELKDMGIAKTALVVFGSNISGNAFWEKQGFAERNDLIYRDKALTKMVKTNT